jgi:hypothetical protein
MNPGALFGPKYMGRVPKLESTMVLGCTPMLALHPACLSALSLAPLLYFGFGIPCPTPINVQIGHILRDFFLSHLKGFFRPFYHH